ncbi:HAD hydrolase-like protein [Bifidobacterium pullorum subsp. saeculare]|uniref:HAD hydrolase-like protein n=1 Tax=Bifidobacterium pullorum subsp. saeculare TaxID=78257 RepID=A0A938WYD9_9BIFI|nr:HAD hydrolase-like protein [Bifidobacterium pullorum]MBM6699293.1 HAD hydrolase-like protein [Bifidobacterium pullorum subsp. saeculare]
MTAPTHPRNVVLLDLDGTLTDSAPGIIASVTKTYQALGMAVPDDAELHRFIGPAIIESFRRNHMPKDRENEAVDTYRRFYAQENIFDDPNNPGQKVPGRFVNTLFDGIPEQVRRLRAEGYALYVATCKPEYQAVPICERFGVTPLVDGVYGASQDNSRLDKDQVIRYCFEHIGFDAAAGDRALMVGDRWTDADGALACGLDCLGCGWGYAEPGELKAHGAYRIIPAVCDLADAVDEYFAH